MNPARRVISTKNPKCEGLFVIKAAAITFAENMEQKDKQEKFNIMKLNVEIEEIVTHE